MKERIAQFLAASDLPAETGVAVAIVRPGSTVVLESFGLRVRDRRLPVTADTLFEAGSLTKGFVSLALSIAAEEGTVDLDAPLNATRPLLPLSDAAASKALTIADVLSHRSGVPSTDLLWFLTQPDKTALFSALKSLHVVPDGFRKTFNYNNILYGALGHAFDTLVGESWTNTVQRRVLDPLQMRGTDFGDTPDITDIALPYLGTRRVPRVDLRCVGAAGSMRSTARDLAAWLQALLSGGAPVSSAAALARVWEPVVDIADRSSPIFVGLEWLDDVKYGLGWFVGRQHGERVLFQPGHIDGFSNVLLVAPERQVGIAVLSNATGSGVPAQLARHLLNSESVTETATIAPEALALVGAYENDAFGRLTIETERDGLVVKFGTSSLALKNVGSPSVHVELKTAALTIPLPVQFEHHADKSLRLHMPLALDPRVPPYVFSRRG